MHLYGYFALVYAYFCMHPLTYVAGELRWLCFDSHAVAESAN